MNKNEIHETAKNMAVEQVLNMYCSKDDPNRPALKQLLENLLDCFMLSERKVALLKMTMTKAMVFTIENLQHLLAVLKSLSLAHVLVISDLLSSLTATKELIVHTLTCLCL